MAKIKTAAIDEKDKNRKCSENDESNLYSDNLFLRENNGDNCMFHNLANQRKLPLKKRFGATFENLYFNFGKEPEKHNNPWIQNRTEKIENILQKTESRNANILPGVIRHTSCPNRSLAYYYDYSVM